jgi:cbb3-type cytochrome oxidase subunit 3
VALIWKLLGEVQVKDLVALTILFGQLVLLLYILYRAQKRKDFDAANFLKDESGKESATRAFAFVCLAVMSWGFAMLIFLDRMTEYYFLVFGALWAGTPVAMEMAKRWNGSLPFGGGGGFGGRYPPYYPPPYPPMYPNQYPMAPGQMGPPPPPPSGAPRPPTSGSERFDDPDSERGKHP